ncbi:MAG: hypothetical protein K2X72_26345 [Reyranella sp.]|nr:hypothetical protein [Reyranella sp.]
MAVLLANPKAWSMAIAASAAYVQVIPNAMMLALVLGAVFAVAAISATLFWCTGGVMLGNRLRSARQWRIVNLMLAGLSRAVDHSAVAVAAVRRAYCCGRRRGSGSGRPEGCPGIRQPASCQSTR